MIHSTIFKAFAFASLLVASAITGAVTINVNTTSDDEPFSYDHEILKKDCLYPDMKSKPCSLRAAVEFANQSAGTDTIKLPTGTYKLTRVGKDEDSNKTGDLDIKSNIIFQGVGAKQTIIDGNLTDRIFHHHDGDLVIKGVTLQHGEITSYNIPDSDYKYGGGAIHSLYAGNILIQNSILQANNSEDFGSAIVKIGHDLLIQNSAIQHHDEAPIYSVILHLGLNFIMQDSVYQANVGGMSILAGNTEITGSKITSNHLSGELSFLISLGCSEGIDGVLMEDTEISYNQANYILSIGSYKNHVCRVKINEALLRNNVSMGILNISVQALGTPGTQVSVTNSTIVDNKQSLQVDENNTHAPVSINADNKADNTFYFDRVAIVNNDYSDHGLVGAIDFIGPDTNSGSAQLSLVNSTISGNKAKKHTIYTHGNGAEPTITLLNITMADNQITFPVFGSLRAEAGKIELVNSLLTDTKNCFSSSNIVSLGNNLTTDDSCKLNQVTDLISEDPKLLPLADNGGNTLTHALPFGSPAIDAGNNELGIDHDQRGKSRPYGGGVDIGAYERGFSRPSTIDPWFKNAD